jgi:hypothetical protein
LHIEHALNVYAADFVERQRAPALVDRRGMPPRALHLFRQIVHVNGSECGGNCDAWEDFAILGHFQPSRVAVAPSERVA